MASETTLGISNIISIILGDEYDKRTSLNSYLLAVIEELW